MRWDGIRSCWSDAKQCCKCRSVTVQVHDELRNGCGWGSWFGHIFDCASSHPLDDFFAARSCGAPFSGMNMDTNWSKSASATHPRRRLRCAQRAAPQLAAVFTVNHWGHSSGHQPQRKQGTQSHSKVGRGPGSRMLHFFHLCVTVYV